MTELTTFSLYENYNYTDGFLVRIDELPTGDGAHSTWVKQLGGYGTLSVSDLELSYDQQPSAPNLYILGSFSFSADFDPSDSGVAERAVHGQKYSTDLFLLQLDGAGEYVNVWQAGGDASDSANDLAIGTSGDVYVIGRSSSLLMQTMAGTLELPDGEDIVRVGDTVLVHVNPVAPQLEITPGASLLEEATVEFYASAPDRQSDGTTVGLSESVVWQLDGVAVGDPLGSSSVTVGQLSIDRHELIATVTDNDGITADFRYVFDVAPNAPTDLGVAVIPAGPSDVEFVFTWSDNSEREGGFYIESTVYEGPLEAAYGWTLEAELDPNTNTASLFVPSGTEEIRYRVRSFAADSDGRIIVSPPSEDVTVQPKATGKDKPKKNTAPTTSIASALEADASLLSPRTSESQPHAGESERDSIESTAQMVEPALVLSSERVAADPSPEESVVATDGVFASLEDDLVADEIALIDAVGL